MLILTGLVLLTMVVLVGFVVLGLRALLLGRDIVWECSLEFPIRIVRRVQDLWQARTRVADLRLLLRMPSADLASRAYTMVLAQLGQVAAMAGIMEPGTRQKPQASRLRGQRIPIRSMPSMGSSKRLACSSSRKSCSKRSAVKAFRRRPA